jgi:hypothetical protein
LIDRIREKAEGSGVMWLPAPLKDVQRKENEMSASGIAPTSHAAPPSSAHSATPPASHGGGNAGASHAATTQSPPTAPGTGQKVNKLV